MLLAGPFAASLLGDFGAEVIKVEQPRTGDPLRHLRPTRDGVPLWWKVTGRNKKSVTLDLRRTEGQELFRQLVAVADVVVEGFQPGTLEGWGLGWDELQRVNPRLVMLRVSAFGQTGPYRHRPGFGRIAEAMSGAVALIGYPDRPPVHPGFPMADYTAGVFGAFAVAGALHERQRSGLGQCIDLALYETLFRLLEFNVVEHDQLGMAREREGNRNAYTAPVNTYHTKDRQWASITASTQAVTKRLFGAIGRPELIEDPRFATIPARLAHHDELDLIIGGWLAEHTMAEVVATFDAHDVPIAPIYTMREIVADPHYAAREDVIEVADAELGPVRMQAALPRFSRTGGRVRWAGPRLGEHNGEILGGLLGLSDAEVAALAENGVI
ncbi:MAG: CoA transferase [Chloroflexi bacterium]|nr:CoA transferase [Chloroflexota bacterium]